MAKNENIIVFEPRVRGGYSHLLNKFGRIKKRRVYKRNVKNLWSHYQLYLFYRNFSFNANLSSINQRKYAFSLAEFLITLLIIGVIATLMAPIYGAIMRHVYATNARRDMLAIENLFAEMRVEFGEYSVWPALNSPEFFGAIEKRINYAKIYSGSVSGGSYNNTKNPYNAPYFGCYDTTCKQYQLVSGKIWTFHYRTSKEFFVGFDTNGPDGPNSIGVDIFWMQFNRGVPYVDSLGYETPTGLFPVKHAYSTDDLLVSTRGRCYRSPMPNSSNVHSYDSAYSPIGWQSGCLELLSRTNWKMEGIYPIKNFSSSKK